MNRTTQRPFRLAARVAVFAALLLGATVFGSTAHAQSSDRGAARLQFDAGVERFSRGDYRGALDAFLGAYNAKPHPLVRINIASCYEKLDDPVNALSNYEDFLDETPDHSTPKAKEVERAVRRLKRQVAEVNLTLSPADATVRVDGTPVSLSPGAPLRLKEGSHSLEFSADGYVSESKSIDLRGGKSEAMNIALLPSEGATGMGVEPGLAAGVAGDGDAGALTTSDETDDDGGSTIFTPRVLIAGGVTLALVVGGAVTGAMALSAKSDFNEAVDRSNDGSLSVEDRRSAYSDGRDASDRADTLSLVSDILFGAAVVGAGLTLYFALTEDGDEQAPATANALRFTPYVHANGAGAVLSGSL
ncbi:MAG: PEGA domain-containing protein [Polyangiales bacterium]|nr:PEGA domain-containing protein [Myxococcales bacterium]